MRTVGKHYDESICGAVTGELRELPKTWSDLWGSATLKQKIRSKRTLQRYLDYLRKRKIIEKRYDEERDRIVYEIVDPTIRSAEQRLKDLLLKTAALKKTIKEARLLGIPDEKTIGYLKKINSPLLSRSPRRLISESVKDWIHSYLMIISYYLKCFLDRRNLKHHAPEKLEYYYFYGPLDGMRRVIQGDLEFIAALMAAKQCSFKEVQEVITDLDARLMKSTLTKNKEGAR